MTEPLLQADRLFKRFGAIAAVWTVFEQLRLREHFAGVRGYRTAEALADTVFVMIANRLIAPASNCPDSTSSAVLSWLPEKWTAAK